MSCLLSFRRCFSSRSKQIQESITSIGLKSMPLIQRPIALQARLQDFFLNAQIDIKRLQRLNRDFYQKAIDAVEKVKSLKVEASTSNEVIKAFKLRYVETESRLGLLTFENEDLHMEVYLCKAKVNVLMQLVEIFDNLHKIASLALEEANEEK